MYEIVCSSLCTRVYNVNNVLYNRWLSWYMFCILPFEVTNTDDQFYLISRFLRQSYRRNSWHKAFVRKFLLKWKEHFVKYLNFSLVLLELIGLLILDIHKFLSLCRITDEKLYLKCTQKKIFQFHCSQHTHAFIQYLYHQNPILWNHFLLLSSKHKITTKNKIYNMYTKELYLNIFWIAYRLQIRKKG